VKKVNEKGKQKESSRYFIFQF